MKAISVVKVTTMKLKEKSLNFTTILYKLILIYNKLKLSCHEYKIRYVYFVIIVLRIKQSLEDL